MTQTSSYFVPTPGQSRLSTDDARDQIDAVLRAECPRLLQEQKPTRTANVAVELDRTGDVQRARITQPSGDERMDEVFGAVAARLHFQPPAAADVKNDSAPGRLRMGYSCAKDAAVGTIEIL
ncbi:MAG TPA: TonB family protein [Gemmatimonadaceae bacterium]|nr:TonB family protein [Gemmatimonadaceae bacterium]